MCERLAIFLKKNRGLESIGIIQREKWETCWGTRECWSCKVARVTAVGERTVEGNKRRKGKFFAFFS